MVFRFIGRGMLFIAFISCIVSSVFAMWRADLLEAYGFFFMGCFYAGVIIFAQEWFLETVLQILRSMRDMLWPFRSN